MFAPTRLIVTISLSVILTVTTLAPYTDQNGDKDPAVDCSKDCYDECGTDCITVFREQISQGPYTLGSLKGVPLPPIKLA